MGYKKKEMLTDTDKVMINNLFKENFYEKKINILTISSIFHKNCVKTFIK